MDKKIKIKTDVIGKYGILQVSHTEHDSRFSIIPNLGASLNAFTVNGKDILVSANSIAEIENQTINSFSGAQLFPYPNRIKDGKHAIGDKTYQLPINDIADNNTIHGLIYNKPFQVTSVNIAAGIVTLRYEYNGDHEGYPFNVVIENRFQLSKNSLKIITTIENIGKQTIPIGHGWHPYFMVNEKLDNAYLEISTTEYYTIDERSIPTGEVASNKSFSKPLQIANTQLDHCFKIKENGLTARLTCPENDLTIRLLTEGYPYLQVYIPPQRNCIALEPQTSIPNAFNNTIGNILLESTEKIKLKFQIIVE